MSPDDVKEVKTQAQVQAEIIAVKATIFDIENKMRQLVAVHKQLSEERKTAYKQLEEAIKAIVPERENGD